MGEMADMYDYGDPYGDDWYANDDSWYEDKQFNLLDRLLKVDDYDQVDDTCPRCGFKQP